MHNISSMISSTASSVSAAITAPITTIVAVNAVTFAGLRAIANQIDGYINSQYMPHSLQAKIVKPILSNAVVMGGALAVNKFLLGAIGISVSSYGLVALAVAHVVGRLLFNKVQTYLQQKQLNAAIEERRNATFEDYRNMSEVVRPTEGQLTERIKERTQRQVAQAEKRALICEEINRRISVGDSLLPPKKPKQEDSYDIFGPLARDACMALDAGNVEQPNNGVIQRTLQLFQKEEKKPTLPEYMKPYGDRAPFETVLTTGNKVIVDGDKVELITAEKLQQAKAQPQPNFLQRWGTAVRNAMPNIQGIITQG